jgi:glyceraldehyde 3-phosphate dehydrogenase
VNDDRVSDSSNLYSAASCTTNAITPALDQMHSRFGIASGHIETIHSFTNDQNLIDNYHEKSRRGRSAVLNMVLTETGAASAVVECLPEVAGKLTANAIRVPTPNVSMAILMLHLEKETTREEVNSYLRQISMASPLQNQINFIHSTELVSSDRTKKKSITRTRDPLYPLKWWNTRSGSRIAISCGR